MDMRELLAQVRREKREEKRQSSGDQQENLDQHQGLRPSDIRRLESTRGALGVRYNAFLEGPVTGHTDQQPPAPGQTFTGDAYPIARPGLSAQEAHRELQAALTMGGGTSMRYHSQTPAMANNFMAKQTLSIVDMGGAPRDGGEPRYHEGNVGIYAYGRRDHRVRSTFVIPQPARTAISDVISPQTDQQGQLTRQGHTDLRTMYGAAATRQTINESIRLAAGQPGNTLRRVNRLRGG